MQSLSDSDFVKYYVQLAKFVIPIQKSIDKRLTEVRYSTQVYNQDDNAMLIIWELRSLLHHLLTKIFQVGVLQILHQNLIFSVLIHHCLKVINLFGVLVQLQV